MICFLRAYHERFGIHLATLKKEMGNPLWKVALYVLFFM